MLKPVQLSDVDKLKPHIMRSRSKEPDYIEKNNKRKSDDDDDDSISPNKSRMKLITDHEVLSFLAL